MIRTLSDLLRHYGDRTLLTLKGDGDGTRTVITFEIDHPAECQMCAFATPDRCCGPVVCRWCSGSGLALDIGGEA